MDRKALAQAIRRRAEEIKNAAEGTEYALDAYELALIPARILEGKPIWKAFGAPGDWGYDTPIGHALAVPQLEPLPGAELIAAERHRVIEREGFDAEHDDRHTRGELVDAALSYIRAAINVGHPAMQRPPQEWPFEPDWWKPSHDSRIYNLIKAGGFIASEIDRLHRLQAGKEQRK